MFLLSYNNTTFVLYFLSFHSLHFFVLGDSESYFRNMEAKKVPNKNRIEEKNVREKRVDAKLG